MCSEIEDQQVVINESFSLATTDVKMVFSDGVQKSLSSSDVTYELLDSEGQSAASTLPEGLSFDANQGKISGTVTTLNFYAPTTYKIKIIGSQHIGGVVGYSNAFTLSMKNSPLPDSVFNINEDTKTLLGFKDEFLNDSASPIYKDNFKNDCNTILIPDRITSVSGNAFVNLSSTTIPEFISHINFSKNSNCSSVGASAFSNNEYITSLTLPSKLTSIQNNGFKDLTMLSSIVWDGWQGIAKSSITQDFSSAGNNVADSIPLIVKVTNQIDDNNSEALLRYLKWSTIGLPDRWEVGE